MKTRSGRRPKHPKPFIRFRWEAIDEVAPGEGEATYWRAFERFEDYAEARARAAKTSEVKRLAERNPAEEWTIGDLFDWGEA